MMKNDNFAKFGLDFKLKDKVFFIDKKTGRRISGIIFSLNHDAVDIFVSEENMLYKDIKKDSVYLAMLIS